MDDYKHGARSVIQSSGARASDESPSAIVYIGTAPVNTIAGGAANVNVPVLVRNIAEAQQLFGYSDDWAKYTLCEAMNVHLEQEGVGPLVLINVLDLTKHKGEPSGEQQLTPENGRITIPSAGDVILDSVEVTEKIKGQDYAVSYNQAKQTITIEELKSGGLGEEAVTVKYDTVDAAKVNEADVIGESDGNGLNTGIHAIKNVYQLTGFYPSYMACPGFSSIPEVHKAMYENSVKVNKHWDVFVFADMPITHKEAPVTMDTAAKFKVENGYDHPNEKTFFPIVKGVDGRKYHLSVLAASKFQRKLIENSGVPYMTPSNSECSIIQSLYLGEDSEGRVFDDALINEKLNAHGITSAAYVGGRWAIWGSQSAAYDINDEKTEDMFDVNRMMLYYISNDFQHRRALDVDRPMTRNDLESIVAAEQARLDSLKNIGALTYGQVRLNVEAIALSDVIKGDFSFSFEVTATPLAKSLTAYVKLTEDGYVTYFEEAA